MTTRSQNSSRMDFIGEPARRAQELADFVDTWRQAEFTKSYKSPEQDEVLEVVFLNNSLPSKAGWYCLIGSFLPAHLSLPVGEFGLLKDRLPKTIDYSTGFDHPLYIGSTGCLRERWRGHHWLKALRKLVELGVQISFNYEVAYPHRDKAAMMSELDEREKELICYLQPILNSFEFWQQRRQLQQTRRGEKPPDRPDPDELKIKQRLFLPTSRRSSARSTPPQSCRTTVRQTGRR